MSQENSITTAGWNDPPSFTYSANLMDSSSATTSPKPIMLPCTQSNAQQQQQQQGVAMTLHTVPNPSEDNIPINLPIITVFRKSLTDNNNKFKPSILLSLNSKLDLLDVALHDGTLPAPVLIILTELTEAVTAHDWNRAYQLHIRLLADYPTFVNGWILAIKKIVLANQE